jgi:hypothetical protein
VFRIKNISTRRPVLAAVPARLAPLCLALAPAAGETDHGAVREVAAAVARECPLQTHLDAVRGPAGFAIDLMEKVSEPAGVALRDRVV